MMRHAATLLLLAVAPAVLWTAASADSKAVPPPDCCAKGTFCCGSTCVDDSLAPVILCPAFSDCSNDCDPHPAPDECCPPEAPDCCGGFCTVGGNGCGIVPGDCTAYCTEKDPCKQKPGAPGPCKASFIRWAFNHKSGTCEKFVYGGCGGNENNFETEAECEHKCLVPTNDCICPAVFDPVCSLDTNTTYGNQCEAGCADDASNLIAGACEETH